MNWAIPRNKAIDITIDVKRTWRWGDIAIADVAEHVTQEHYRGKSWRHAARLLARDARERFWTQYAGRTVEQERAATEIAEMTNALVTEGWKLLDLHDSEFVTGYMWRHVATGISINRGGGLFVTFDEATRAAFNSVTRELIKQ